MQWDEIIDNSTGVTRILDRFESDLFLNKILICVSLKQGKTYAFKYKTPNSRNLRVNTSD